MTMKRSSLALVFLLLPAAIAVPGQHHHPQDLSLCREIVSWVSLEHQEQAASSFCSSYLHISTATTTATTQVISTVTATSTATAILSMTETTQISSQTTISSTATATATVTKSTTTTSITTTVSPYAHCVLPASASKRDGNAAPGWSWSKPPGWPSEPQTISSVCSCFHIPTPTTTETVGSTSTTTATTVVTTTSTSLEQSTSLVVSTIDSVSTTTVTSTSTTTFTVSAATAGFYLRSSVGGNVVQLQHRDFSSSGYSSDFAVLVSQSGEYTGFVLTNGNSGSISTEGLLGASYSTGFSFGGDGGLVQFVISVSADGEACNLEVQGHVNPIQFGVSDGFVLFGGDEFALNVVGITT